MDDLQRALGRIEGKVDAILFAQSQHHDRLGNHASRLDNLEQSRDRVRGAGRLTAFILAPGATILALVAWSKDFFSGTGS